jgi:hypothetical protein
LLPAQWPTRTEALKETKELFPAEAEVPISGTKNPRADFFTTSATQTLVKFGNQFILITLTVNNFVSSFLARLLPATGNSLTEANRTATTFFAFF